MKRHASMNRIYRLVWSRVQNAWIAVSENAKGQGKSGRGKSALRRKIIVTALSLAFAPLAHAGPVGGQLVSGAGSISQSGATTTINQSSQNLSLNWQSFNVAPTETVNFLQPSAAAIAVNRIFDTNGSQILGHLNANGQVWLVNPNGVLFGQGAQVNVGGLVASTLDFRDASLNSGSTSFSGSGAGSVINQGTINAASGGYVALLGNHVSNQGTITAQLGTVALGAGSAATLTFSGNSLVHMQVELSTLNNLAENGGLIQADGGQVIMSAGAKNALLASVVNNTGVIEARTVENHEGTITLRGGMMAGTVNVGGTLDAGAPNGGNGGFVETSAAHVKVANDANVTTAASSGLAGTWLIDPDGFTIASSGGDMTGTTLSNNLNKGDVIIASTGGSGSDGNVNVNDAVTWSNNQLTLNATNDININAVMAANNASLDLEPGASGTVNVGMNASGFTGRVDFFKADGTTPRSGVGFLTIGGNGYTVITSVGAAGNATTAPTTATLQGMAAPANLTAASVYYALGSNLDASSTSTWNAGAGFTPVGDSVNNFTGTFDGLGHTISNLTIYRPTTNVGLFGFAYGSAVIRNVGLVGASVSGNNSVGGLVGTNYGSISNSFSVNVTGSVTSNVSGTGKYVGGLVGANYGTVNNSYATVSVSGSSYVGGLVGFNGISSSIGTISNCYATGNVIGTGNNVGGLAGANYGMIGSSYATGSINGSSYVGGLVGLNSGGTISTSYATGNVGGAKNVGGLAGANNGTINLSYATGNVTGAGNNVGGLVGANYGMIGSSYATGSVSGSSYVGGLVGLNNSGTISTSYATGKVSGTNDVGGLAGANNDTINLSSYATGNVIGTGNNVGGLAGANYGTISSSYATGSVSGSSYVGGLAGLNGSTGSSGSISSSYATGSVNGGSDIGGLVGHNWDTISDSYAIGNVSGTGIGSSNVGGLAGGNDSTISNSYAVGSVSGSSNVGGLVGNNSTGTVSGSFWNTDVNAIGTGLGTGGLGLTTAQMQTQANFTSAASANGNVNPGWDFTSTWVMYEGYTAPLLRAFMTPLTVTAFNAAKTYDGLTSVVGNGVTYSSTTPNMTNLLGTLNYTAGGVNVGSTTITPGGLYSTQQGYLISFASGSLTINPAPLTITALSGTNRTYDGTTVDALSGTAVLSGLVGTETLTLGGTTNGTLASANAGSEAVTTAVTIANGTGLASNYTLTQPTLANVTITPAPLTVSTGNVVKTYDGTLTAAGTPVVTSGTLYTNASNSNAQDSLTGGTFAFTNANAGTGNKTVTVTGITVNDGNGGGNYTVIKANNTTSTINPANLTVSTSNVVKTYDGTLAAAGTPVVTSGTLYTNASNGNVQDSLTGGTFAFTNANAGTGNKTVTVTGITVNDGNGGGNYNVTGVSNTTSTINPASLTVTANNAVMPFGTANPALGVSYSGFVPGDTSSSLTTQATATAAMSSPNAGSYAITASGAVDPNYTISYVNGTLTVVPLVLNGGSFAFPTAPTTSSSALASSAQTVSSPAVNQPIAITTAIANLAPRALTTNALSGWGTISIVDGGVLMPDDSSTP